MKLKVNLSSNMNQQGKHQYSNVINSDDYKQVALILMDLKNHNVPIEKAFKEYVRLTKSDFEIAFGI